MPRTVGVIALALLVWCVTTSSAARNESGIGSVSWPQPDQLQVDLNRPAVALLVEIVSETAAGAVSVNRTTFDDFLRNAHSTIRLGTTAVTNPEVLRTYGRIRFVEYEDGSTAGDLQWSDVSENFEPLRQLVRTYARQYGQLIETRSLAVAEATLAASLARAAAAPDTDTSWLERRALDQIAVNLRLLRTDPAALSLRLSLLAR